MGDIAVEQGFFSEDSGTIDKPDFADSGEALGIADAITGEVWVFNIMTGKNNRSAIWAAQRLPDDHVTSVGNSFTIRKMKLDEPDNFMYSPGVADLAIEMGWWDAQGKDPNTFDFFGSYGYLPPDKPTQNLKAFYSGRRMWRVFNLLSPQQGATLDPATGNLPNTKSPYPFSMPAPAGSVSLEMVMGVHRDHYEGTPYDLTKGMAAGPFGNPNRGGSMPKDVANLGQWERAISLQRTSISYVCEARPNGLSLTWTGWDAPHGTAYLPLYGAAETGPPSFSSIDGHMSKFSPKVAWWAFNFVNQYQDLNFQLINAEVRTKAAVVELRARESLQQWEASGKSIDELTSLTNEFAESTVANWWEFAWYLVTKYGRYVVTYNETEKGEGKQHYPEWWARSPEVGYTRWTVEGPNVGGVSTSISDGREIVVVVSVACAAAALVGVLAFFAGRRSMRRSLMPAGSRARALVEGEQTEVP
jgi:dipeptidase